MTHGTRLLAAAGLAALLAAGPAAAQTTMKLAHDDPPGGLRQQASELFAAKVKEGTQGRLAVEVHHSGTLGFGAKLIEQVRLGAIDFTLSGIAIYGSQVPELGLLALPYLVESYEQGWALYDTSPWVKKWMDKAQEKNLRMLATWEAGFRQFTAKKPVRTPEDVKGMKIRIAQNQVYLWLWQTMGANPTVLPLGEVYIGLQQGVVDAQENPIPTIIVNKFHEVAPQISLTNHIYAPIPFAMNERRWQALSAADRALVQRAANETAAWHRKAVVAEEDQMLEEMKAKGAVITRPDLAAFTRASRPVFDRAAEKFPKDVVEELLRDVDAVKAKLPAKS